MLEAARISMLVLCVLVAVGGIMGFLKAQSKASLISGVISGALLGVAYYVAGRNAMQGMVMGAVICILLCIVFGIRLKKTGKFMPAGLLLILSVVELAVLGASIAMK
jgi:uncharacterized membrane protein (UPF0136 family)